MSGCRLVRRAPLALAVFLALAAAACSAGGDGPKPLSTQAPKEPADAFVAEMLNGRPTDAAERLASTQAGFAFDLPQISIELQTNAFRVAESKRRNNTSFVYLLRGRRNGKPVSAPWVVALEKDLDSWRIGNFTRAKTYLARAVRRSCTRFSVPARRRARFGRCSKRTASAAPNENATTGHGSPRTSERTGSDKAAIIEETDA